MVLSFLYRAYGPLIAYLLLLAAALFGKESIGWAGLPLIVLGLPAALFTSLRLTIGRRKLTQALQSGWDGFWKTNTTLASQLFAGGLCLLVLVCVLSLPGMAYFLPPEETVRSVIVLSFCCLGGLTALLIAGKCWRHFVEQSGADPASDAGVATVRQCIATVRPVGKPLAILLAAAALVGIGIVLGAHVAASIMGPHIRVQILKELRESSQLP